MQRRHPLTTIRVFWLSMLWIMFSTPSIASICPGLDPSAPPFPTIRRLEIFNPQVPSRPHTANPRNVSEARTLMALQGETIDLIYTMAEPIPAGCTYSLVVLRTMNRPTPYNRTALNLPIEALAKPEQSHSSEVTTGDQTIRFKIEPAPQVGEDKTHTLYASLLSLQNSYISENMPFTFRNQAYKILNVNKAPYNHSDADYSVSGYTLNITLNALPIQQSTDNQARLKMYILQKSPLPSGNSTADKPIAKVRSNIAVTTQTSSLSKNMQVANLQANLNKSTYILHTMADLTNGIALSNALGANRVCQEYSPSQGFVRTLLNCTSVTVLNNTPTVISKINTNGDVNIVLGAKNDNSIIANLAVDDTCQLGALESQFDSAFPGELDKAAFCASPVLVDLPE